jgi:hypothetical protein
MTPCGQADVLPPQPYPGLRAFHQDEWAIFFGREEHADEVITKLGRHSLVLVHGSSGCGKSSLIRAGVMPMLETNHQIDGKVWRTATMRPSEGLLTRLADVLEEALPQSGTGADGSEPTLPWGDLVLKGGGLVEHVEAAIQASGGGAFCLLIDQFEEIFRWARERSDAQARLFIEFLKRVCDKGEEGGFYVILTMRSDYFGNCANYDGFAEFLNPRQYLLPRMDEFGLLRAIYEPAQLYGGTIDTAVASTLLPVVKVHLDGLPVLQHALMRASDQARKRYGPDEPWLVTGDDLAEVGGAANALAEHAEQIFERATGGDPELVEAAEWIFRALTDLDADRRAIRRPCTLKELIEVSGVDREKALAIIDPFRAPDCTFISPYLPESIGDDDELDISHEALIRQWPRLCGGGIDKTSRPTGWVYREFHDGLVWRSLAVQAEEFSHNPDHLLSVATTEQRLPWFREIKLRSRWTRRHALAERRHDMAVAEKQWKNVEAMMAASERNLKREHSIVGRLRLSRNVSLIFAVIAMVAIGISFSTWRALAKANEDKIRANEDKIRSSELTNAALQQTSQGLIVGFCSQRHPGGGLPFNMCRDTLTQSMQQDFAFRLRALSRSQSVPAYDALPTFPEEGRSGSPPARNGAAGQGGER